MKTSIDHFPNRTKQELSTIVELIKENVKGCEMIILFGSYAKGTQVLWDEKFDFGIHTTYQSDLDILVVISNNFNSILAGQNIRSKVYHKYHSRMNEVTQMSPNSKVKLYTSPQFVVEYLSVINEKLDDKQYFYTEIINDGIVLFDSGEVKLSEPRELSFEDIKRIVVGEYDEKMARENRFLHHEKNDFNDNCYKDGVFQLHQACERYCSAVSVVFSNNKPKTHEIKELGAIVKSYSRELAALFPENISLDSVERTFEEHCYDLLCRAYVDARYDKKFDVTKQEYGWILSKTEMLKDITERICAERIES